MAPLVGGKKKEESKNKKKQKGPFFLFLYFNTKIICNAKIMMPFYIYKYKKNRIDNVLYMMIKALQ